MRWPRWPRQSGASLTFPGRILGLESAHHLEVVTEFAVYRFRSFPRRLSLAERARIYLAAWRGWAGRARPSVTL